MAFRLMSEAAKVQPGFDLDYGQHTPRHGSMEKESDLLHFAQKPWIPAQAGDIRPRGSRSPWSCGSRSPKLLGVLVGVERNPRPGYDL